MKKIYLICISMILLVAMLLPMTGCGNNTNQDGDGVTTGSIKITAVDLGYGVEWLREIIAAYEDENPGCTVELEVTVDGGSLASKIRTKANDNDLVISTGAFFNSQAEGYLYDLSSLLNTTQEGYDVPLSERMNKDLLEYYKASDGKYYQLPWVYGYNGILYNKTTIDAALGAENYTLPRTSDEMTELCERIKSTGVAPFVLSTEVPYWQSVLVGMYYQYQGEEEYNKFYEGYYLKNGTYTKATSENYREFLESQIGVKKAADVVYSWLGEKEFAHSKSGYMNYQQAQNVFCGLGYGTDMTKAAFMVCGDWFYNEMKESIDRATEVNGGCDVRVMKVPVISSIVERLENKNMTEAQLREVIDAIDAGAKSVAGVSDKDFATLYSARFSSTSAATSHVMAIPKMKNSEHKYELTLKFMNYVFSYTGQELFSYELNGITMPYGYEPTGVYGEYADSRLECMGNLADFNVITEGHNSPLYYIGGMDIIAGYYEKDAFNKTKNGEAYFQSCIELSYNNKDKVLPLIR